MRVAFHHGNPPLTCCAEVDNHVYNWMALDPLFVERHQCHVHRGRPAGLNNCRTEAHPTHGRRECAGRTSAASAARELHTRDVHAPCEVAERSYKIPDSRSFSALHGKVSKLVADLPCSHVSRIDGHCVLDKRLPADERQSCSTSPGSEYSPVSPT